MQVSYNGSLVLKSPLVSKWSLKFHEDSKSSWLRQDKAIGLYEGKTKFALREAKTKRVKGILDLGLSTSLSICMIVGRTLATHSTSANTIAGISHVQRAKNTFETPIHIDTLAMELHNPKSMEASLLDGCVRLGMCQNEECSWNLHKLATPPPLEAIFCCSMFPPYISNI